ncbi:hypothetical protein AB2B41_13575 [Marimonas sp. MJW-29]|uniref:Glycosyltransferase RgtA/B/C/D-like domain-containing protein n=1 Tax=Sulfitobacter sediminis TaxID=3234186 RepID=A0ABV3RPP8_9RHOB
MSPETLTASGGALAQGHRAEDIQRAVVRIAILSALMVMAAMAWTRNVNWDEFYFLSHIHAHLGGYLDRPLQTAFVHAFSWLARVPGHEVDQIASARLVMMCFFAATCLSIHRISAALADEASADIAVLAFLTSGFAIAHGGSFRADPMAASLLMGAVALIMTTRMGLWSVLGVGVLSALALLVTVKSALYLPVFLAAILWRWDDRSVVLRIVGAGALALLIAGALFHIHAASLTIQKTASGDLGEAARITLGGSGLLPRIDELALWAMLSAGPFLLALAGLRFAPNRKMQAVLILFSGPLLSVILYRNAFPYFFPFAVPPLMIAVALGARALQGKMIWKLALVLMLASGGMQALRALNEDNAAQRATIAEVHRLFPAPTAYIDQNGMMSSFPRHGFFMSTWGIATYRAAGRPVMADLIAREKPPLLLANRAELRAALRPEKADPTLIGLLPEDAEVLRSTYVHHAGAIWLAGQEAQLGMGRAVLRMPFAGRYRLEATGPVVVNGVRLRSGDVAELPETPLRITAAPGTHVRLIWYTGAGPARSPLPETDLYAGFWRL